MLRAGHGLNSARITGLPDAGPFTDWALPIATYTSNALATVTVGLAVTAAFLLPGGEAGGVSPQAYRLLRLAGRCALAWAVVAVALIVLTVSDVLGAPRSEAHTSEL